MEIAAKLSCDMAFRSPVTRPVLNPSVDDGILERRV
jgi:hypothetical protein